MNKLAIIGLVLLAVGIISFFYVDEEPLSTLCGIITGVGFGLLIYGVSTTGKSK